MDFGAIGERVLFAVVVVGFVLMFSFFRRRDPKKARAELVHSLLSETRINLVLIDTFDRQPVARRFETSTWQLNHNKKLQFLEKTVQTDMDDAFKKALDYNLRLKAAKKSKSAEKVVPDLGGMKPLFLRIKEGLEDWLLVNVGTVEQPPQFTGMFDGMFGPR